MLTTMSGPQTRPPLPALWLLVNELGANAEQSGAGSRTVVHLKRDNGPSEERVIWVPRAIDVTFGPVVQLEAA